VLSEDLVAAVERLVDVYAAEGAQPGLAYGVVAGGALVHSGGRGTTRATGPAVAPDRDTVFRIASMTKSFTAAVLLQLRDEGRLALDDEVATHVPEFAAVRPHAGDAPAITVRSLLTMSAGLPTDDPWGDRQQGLPAADFTALLAGGLSLAWTPGTAFEYSNLGYAVLGRVVEAVAGRPYREVVHDRLLVPLGMGSTVFAAEEVPVDRLATGHRADSGTWRPVPLDPYGAFAPMGGLFSTVRDLSVWVAGMAAAYPPRSGPDEPAHPLRRSSRREAQQVHRVVGPQAVWTALHEPPEVRCTGYGLGLLVELDAVRGEVVGHSGGYPGFGSNMRWHPGTGLGVVVLGNATYAPAYQLAATVLELLVADARAHRRPAVRGPAPGDGRPWPATLAAREAVQHLLTGWDDDLAAAVFAGNVDLDEPLADRRATVERAREQLGALDPEPGPDEPAQSPAHQAWWVHGPGGRARVEIRLTPQLPPLVQSLSLTVVHEPGEALRAAAAAVAAELGAQHPDWPAVLVAAPPLTTAAGRRALLAGAAWAGACSVGAVTACGGTGSATFVLHGEHADLVLDLSSATPSGPDAPTTLTALVLRPVPPR